jgi:hypothetical protein
MAGAYGHHTQTGVAQGHSRVERGSDERVPERGRRDGLADSGAAGDLTDDPPGTVPVQPPPVRSQEDRSFGAFADDQVDRPGGPRRQRDGVRSGIRLPGG